MNRYKITVYLIHNFEKDSTDSTKMGTFETKSIKGIRSEVLLLLQLSGLKFESLIDIVDYYAVLRVSGSNKGNVVDVCVDELETYSFQSDLEMEFIK